MIEWTSELETGMRVIDIQHRELVAVINELESGLNTSAAPSEINKLLERLTAYINYHFACEEGLMEQRGLVGEELTRHAAQHAEFAAEVSNTVAKASRQEETQLRDLLRFLTDWLIRHVCATDKAMVQRIRTLST